MSPPKLSADTPVLDVFQPVLIGVLILGGIEFQFVVHYRWQGHVGKVLHLEEPLHRELRFDRHTGTFRATHLVGIGFNFFQKTGILQIFFDLLAHVEAVHADVKAGGFAQCAVVVKDVDRGEVVFFAQHVVVHVVGRSNLQATSTELDIDIVVFDDGDNAVYQWHDDLLTLQPFVLGVVGVDTHGGIAHDGFGTSSSHYGITSFGIALYHITQVVELAMLFLVDYLFVGEGGKCFGVPVYHASTAVNQAFVIEVAEYLDNAIATLLVHGEGGTIPVARCTKFAKLLQDDASVFVCPLPSVLQELLASEVGLLDALSGQFVHHLGFGSDGCVVGTRHPAGVLAFHASAAHQDILNGIIKHVSHVEHTGDGGGRNDDGVRLTTIGFRTEQFMVQPILVPLSLHISGVVLTC